MVHLQCSVHYFRSLSWRGYIEIHREGNLLEISRMEINSDMQILKLLQWKKKIALVKKNH